MVTVNKACETEPSTRSTKLSTDLAELSTGFTEPSSRSTKLSTDLAELSTVFTEPSTKSTKLSTDIAELSTVLTELSSLSLERVLLAALLWTHKPYQENRLT